MWDASTFSKNRDRFLDADVALTLVDRPGATRRITPGADKGYDAQAFIGELHNLGVTPHIAAGRRVSKTGVVRHSAIDRSTTGTSATSSANAGASGSRRCLAG